MVYFYTSGKRKEKEMTSEKQRQRESFMFLFVIAIMLLLFCLWAVIFLNEIERLDKLVKTIITSQSYQPSFPPESRPTSSVEIPITESLTPPALPGVLPSGTPTPSPTPITTPLPPAALISGERASFSDLFSGVGWLDLDKTTVYQDRKALRLFLPPSFQWQEITNTSAFLILNNLHVTAFSSSFNTSGLGAFIVGDDKGKIFALSGDFNTISDLSADLPFNGFETLWPEYSPPSQGNPDGFWLIAGLKANTFRLARFSLSSALKVNSSAYWDLNIPSAVIGQPPEDRFTYTEPLENQIQIKCLPAKCLVRAGSDFWFVSGDSEPVKIANLILSAINQANSQTTKEILKLSIGKTNSFWLVGSVRGSAGNYRGSVFKFDASQVEKILAEDKFSSPYLGVFGFGGQADDFLAVYGAYGGRAYRMQNSEPRDFSEFFPFRIMDEKGYRPEILKLPDSWGKPAWFIGAGFSLPKFLRWEGGVNADLTENLKIDQSSYDLLALGPLAGEVFAAVVFPASGQFPLGGTKFYKFQDLGFDNSQSRQVVSSKLNNKGERILSAYFYEILDDVDDGKIRYYLSADAGANWQPVNKANQVVEFSSAGDLRWKAEFTPAADRFKTPSLRKVGVEWTYK